VVAVKYSWYLAMQGQALYIPGYGRATIEDVCGGCVGKPWIDLGYTDAQFAQAGDQWGKYVTVYFLAPAPGSIIYVLQ
jgi:3D (Asp-Asp-Asp) domain-containing protein